MCFLVVLQFNIIHKKFGRCLMNFLCRNHWALTVVNPDKEIVHFLDPMRRRLCGEEWRTVVDK